MAMLSLRSLRRSSLSTLPPCSIRWLSVNQLSTSSSSSVSASISADDRSRIPSFIGSFLKLTSGILLGSGLGFLYVSGSSATPALALAESTAVDSAGDGIVEQPCSNSFFRKFSLPEISSKFLFKEEFRRKVFFNYEKRIRLYSPPEKVFEYFASFRAPDGELLMRPMDLMRAVIPVFPPSESHLVRDGYLSGERNPGMLRCAPSDLLMLFDINNDGLVSFKEYIFLKTLLSIPESSFLVTFKMFDRNDDGEIDKEEFKKVMALMRSHIRQGAQHRNGHRSRLIVDGCVENGGLVDYFFGKDGDAGLQLDKFVQFMKNLKIEMLRLEFAHYDYKLRGTISAKDFALSMVASADSSHLSGLLDRVNRMDDNPHFRDIRVTWEEFKDFDALRTKLQPFSLALFSYGKVNGFLTKNDFQRAACQVCGINLTDEVVDIIFHLFDTNCDGELSAEEFIRVLHNREKDVAQPLEAGMMGLFSRSWSCETSS
ncbi:calcium uptake protein, mitochondrial-like [Cucurbita maxima]|uniref:Calcium uptake protein, mitochondrial-like n=1 Tax=Cucurbita maxima TaxID=3661 RepID=A0A6J1JU04_CUCMA|nr:calcium uptake protein, mitochondrial-like [Cucurbita maxima]